MLMTDMYTLDDCVAALRSGRMGSDVQGPMGLFLREPENVVAFFELVDGGAEFTFAATNLVRKLSQQMSSWDEAALFWRNGDWFEQDDAFTDTRMQLIGSAMRQQPVKDGVRVAGLRQVRRMCEAGRTDPFRVLSIAPDVNNLDYRGEDEFLLAYDAGWMNRLADIIEQLQNVRNRSVAYGNDPRIKDAVIQALKTKQDIGERIKADVFVNIWLKAAISETEYASVKNLPVPLLCDLYPQVWERGYGGYRARVMAGEVKVG